MSKYLINIIGKSGPNKVLVFKEAKKLPVFIDFPMFAYENICVQISKIKKKKKSIKK